ALAADPQRVRLLDRPRKHRHLVELPELAVERDLVPAPAAPHDRDGFVRALSALLERDTGSLELTLQLDTDADRGQRAAARDVVEHRELARHHDGRTARRDEDAGA